jgi:hypothetical protein
MDRHDDLAPIFEAVHWTAVIFAGMLAVLFLSWAVVLTAPKAGSVDIISDPTQSINPTF